MRSNQWYVLGFAFLILMNWFIYQDVHYNCLKLDKATAEKIDRLDIYECVNSEIYDPFIWLFGVLWIVCWINGWIENRSKKKEEKERYGKALDEGKEKDFVAKMARKFKLKHLPQNIPELAHWSKIEGKEKEIDKEIDKYVKEELEELKRRYR